MTTRISLLLLLATALTGCSYVEELKLPFITQTGKSLPVQTEDGKTVEDGPLFDPESVDLTPRHYPQALPIAKSLDIEVRRDGNAIVLDNRTVNSYPNAQIWLNRSFGADVQSIDIGSNKPLNLRSFVNQHGEVYPVARFLAPDADQPLVLADLIVDGKIHKLHVRLEDWRHP
jgi:hypothetical protein